MRKLRLTDEGHLLRLPRPTAVSNGASADAIVGDLRQRLGACAC
jgi:hypothetical protein